jgi:hypothetical protein
MRLIYFYTRYSRVSYQSRDSVYPSSLNYVFMVACSQAGHMALLSGVERRSILILFRFINVSTFDLEEL